MLRDKLNPPDPTPRFGPADAVILDSAFTGIGDVLEGRSHIDSQSFYNLCTVVEASILHPKLFGIGFFEESPLFSVLKEKVIFDVAEALGNIRRTELESTLVVTSITRLFMDAFKTYIGGIRLTSGQWGSWLNVATTYAQNGSFLGDRQLKEALSPMFNYWSKLASLPVPIYGNVMELPFFLREDRKVTIPVELYGKLADAFKVKLDRLNRYLGTKAVYIPPLVAILLSRCRTQEQIPEQLLRLRDEFTELRVVGEKYQAIIWDAGTLAEKFDALEELEEAWGLAAGGLEQRQKHTKLVHRAWDIIRSADPKKMASDTIDALIDKGLEKCLLKHIKSYLDIWKATQAVTGYERLIPKVFNREIGRRELVDFRKYAKAVEALAFPTGRC